MKKGIIQNFQFYENEKLFKDGKYLTISFDFVRCCEGIFKLQITNLKLFKHCGHQTKKVCFSSRRVIPPGSKNKTKKKKTNYQVQLYNSFLKDCNEVAVFASVFRLFHILAP